MIEVVHVSSKGQIVIPERVRENFGITEGSKLVLLEQDDEIILKKEEDVEKRLRNNEGKETVGWMMLAEKSLRNVWDNPKDESVWKKYL